MELLPLQTNFFPFLIFQDISDHFMVSEGQHLEHVLSTNKAKKKENKLSCQLEFGCTVINICCLISINLK